MLKRDFSNTRAAPLTFEAYARYYLHAVWRVDIAGENEQATEAHAASALFDISRVPSLAAKDGDRMIYPETDELSQYPRYVLALLAAERARLLREGAKPLVPVDGLDFNPLTVALQEIAEGKIRPRIIDEHTVEVIIQGPEHTWQVARDLKQLSKQTEEEEAFEEEAMQFYQQETTLRE
ncbi:MAG: DNA-directed RNA polymerase subunit omega [Fimbriimonadales bacterium]|nr:DNA-directed RNA polymerase subunit omega [Fimbriimonadales bacterium]